MKILLINNYHYLRGGSERSYFDTGKILADKGHTVAYFSTQNTANAIHGANRYFIQDCDLAKKYSLFKKLKIAIKMLYNFEAKKKLKKLLQEFQPDIVHLHNIYHHLSPSIIDAVKAKNIPIVMTLHDYKLISPNYNLFLNGQIWEKSLNKKYYNCLLDRCVQGSLAKSFICTIEAYLHRILGTYGKIDLFISPSIFLKNKFEQAGFKGKIIHLPNPLLNDYLASEDVQDVGMGKYILYFGRLSGEKGIDDLIKAYGELNSDKKLFIVGKGPQEEYLKKLARDKGLQEKIEFLGYKTGDELKSLIKNCAFVVMPSKWQENSPYSLIEAMSLTKITVCAKIGGFTEMIKNGETGYHYKSANIKELTKIMSTIIDNNEHINNLIGTNAKNYVITKHNQEKYYENLINAYNNLIT